MTRVPLCDPGAENAAVGGEIGEAVRRVLEGGRYILGGEVEAFEQEAAAYLGVRHAVGVANGSDALYLALRALGVGSGDEVIVPAFTFFATAGAVVRAGARPVFADVCPETFNIDPADAAGRVTSRTRAIVPVHLYGQPADMEEIGALARRHGLYVVEDAAQAFGARYRGTAAGALGHVGCFSFFPTKNLGCCGDGGLVTTDDDRLADCLRLLRVHGARPKYHHRLLGINSRLDAVQAAILRVKLRRLDQWNARRGRLAAGYDEALEAAGLTGSIIPPVRRSDRTHVFHQYTVKVPQRRDDLQQALIGGGIGCAVYYPGTLPDQPALARWAEGQAGCPRAGELTRQVLSLPMGAVMPAGVLEAVVGRLAGL